MSVRQRSSHTTVMPGLVPGIQGSKHKHLS